MLVCFQPLPSLRHTAEAVHQWEEAEKQSMIDKARVWMEREQQEEQQVQVWAITVTQGSRMPGPLMTVAGPAPRACKRCTLLLGEPEGCVVSERGKARACLPCQKVCKACIWPLGPGGVVVAMGSGTEASGKPAPRQVRKRVERTMTNT